MLDSGMVRMLIDAVPYFTLVLISQLSGVPSLTKVISYS
jgi:hypothetical protein